MRRPGWLAALLVLTASASLMHHGKRRGRTSPEQQQLVSAYAPELMLREQTAEHNCNTREEQYNPPTTVDVVLGNPAVKLVHYVGGQGPADQDGVRPPRTSRGWATTTTSTFRATRSTSSAPPMGATRRTSSR